MTTLGRGCGDQWRNAREPEHGIVGRKSHDDATRRLYLIRWSSRSGQPLSLFSDRWEVLQLATVSLGMGNHRGRCNDIDDPAFQSCDSTSPL